MSPAPTRRKRRRKGPEAYARGGRFVLPALGFLPALCGLLFGCGSTGEEDGTVVQTSPQPVATASVQPMLQALGAAIEEGEDELARQIVVQLRRRSLTEREAEVLATFVRILRGRELVAALDFELESRLTDEDGRYEIVLRVSQSTGLPMELRLPPADLERLTVGVDERGLEGRDFGSRTIDALLGLVLPADETIELPLGRYPLVIGRALAVRDRWRLVMRSGELVLDGESFPAARLPAPESLRVLHSEDLPPAPVSPEELVNGVADSEYAPEDVLRLAVRVPLAERAAALDALAPRVVRLARDAPERVTAVASALRWISHSRDPGGDARAWAAWFAAWERREPEGERPRLDLPAESAGARGPRGGREDKLQLP